MFYLFIYLCVSFKYNLWYIITYGNNYPLWRVKYNFIVETVIAAVACVSVTWINYMAWCFFYMWLNAIGCWRKCFQGEFCGEKKNLHAFLVRCNLQLVYISHIVYMYHVICNNNITLSEYLCSIQMWKPFFFYVHHKILPCFWYCLLNKNYWIGV